MWPTAQEEGAFVSHSYVHLTTILPVLCLTYNESLLLTFSELCLGRQDKEQPSALFCCLVLPLVCIALGRQMRITEGLATSEPSLCQNVHYLSVQTAHVLSDSNWVLYISKKSTARLQNLSLLPFVLLRALLRAATFGGAVSDYLS